MSDGAGPDPLLQTRGMIHATAVATITLALFFLPALGPGAQFLCRDTGRIHHPTRRWIAERLARGELPEWNPYAGLGSPVVGGAMDAPLHPFNAWLVALPYEAGFKAWILSCYLMAALGGYALCRALRCGWHASLAAGLAFALSGHLVSSSDNLTFLGTLAALPWIFAAAERFFEGGGPGALAALGLASAVCASGGDPQGWAVAMGLLMPQAFLLRGGTAKTRLGRGAAAVLVAAGAAAPVILPVLAWLPHSSRAHGLLLVQDLDWELRPLRLVEVVVPGLLRDEPGAMTSAVFDAFGGVRRAAPWVVSIHFGLPVLLLALFAGLRQRRARILLAGAILLGWAALGHRAGFGQLARHLPVLNGFRYWEKMFVWPTLLFCVAAALGLDALTEGTPAARRGLAAASAGLAGLLAVAWAGFAILPAPAALAARAGGGALWRNLADGSLAAVLAGAALALVTMAAQRPALSSRAPALLSGVVVLASMAANGHAYNLGAARLGEDPQPLATALGPSPPHRIFTAFSFNQAQRPDRTELEAGFEWGRRTLEACWNIPAHVGNLSAYAALPPDRLQRLRDGVATPRLARMAGLWGMEALVVPASPELASRAKVIAPPLQVLGADAELPAYLVAITHRPRARLASQILEVGEAAAFDFVQQAEPGEQRTALEGPVPAGYRPPRGRVSILRDDPERVELSVESDGTALLVLEDQHAPGWTAMVDGAPAAILRADWLGRALWVGPGRHAVAFEYRTPGLRLGLAVAVATFGALGGAALIQRRRRRSSRPS